MILFRDNEFTTLTSEYPRKADLYVALFILLKGHKTLDEIIVQTHPVAIRKALDIKEMDYDNFKVRLEEILRFEVD